MADLEDVKLDGRPLQSLRVADLKAALEERGLPKSGQKNALIKRLKGALMLENLQRTSHHHIGLQPNSQIGEEMSQNSFIKQYLAKQQELLRQRLEREAREAVEDDDTDQEDHTQDNNSSACAAPDPDVAPVLVDQHKLLGPSEGEGLAGPASDGEGHMSRDGHVSGPPAPTSPTSAPAAVASLAVRVAGGEQRPERVPTSSQVPADGDDDGADEDWDSGARRRNLVEPPRGQLARARSGGSHQHPQHIPPLLSPQLRQPTPPPSPPPELSFPLPDTPKQSPPSPGEPPARQCTSSTSSSGSSSSGSRSSSPEPQSNAERKPGPLTLLARKMASEGAFSGVGWHGRGDAERQDNNAATATMSSGRGPQEGIVSAITHTTNAAASLPFPRQVTVTNQGVLGGHLPHSEVPVSVLRPTIMEERDAAWQQENKEKELQAEREREKALEQDRLRAVEQEKLERQRIFEQQRAVEQNRERALERGREKALEAEREETERALEKEREEGEKAMAREKALELVREKAMQLEKQRAMERERALEQEREERERALERVEREKALERERQEREKSLERELLEREKALELERQKALEREEREKEREEKARALKQEIIERAKALEKERAMEKEREEREKALEHERENKEIALEQEKVLQREKEERERALQQEKILQREKEERERALEQEKVLQREKEERERALQQEKVLQREKEERERALEQEKVLQREKEERERALQQEKILQREKDERERALEQEKVLQREKEEMERALEQEKVLQREKRERERALEQEKVLQRAKEERERALEQEKVLQREKEERERALEQEKVLQREKEERERALEQEEVLQREKERALEQEKVLQRMKEERERALEQEKVLQRAKEERERALEQEKVLQREKEERERALEQEKVLQREKEERERALEQEKVLQREKEERERALEQEKVLQREKEERERALEQEEVLQREKERALEREKVLQREKEERGRALEQEKVLQREKEERERALEQEKLLQRAKEERERALEQDKVLQRAKEERERALEQEKVLQREREEREIALEQEEFLQREKERALEQEKVLQREKERALEQEEVLQREREERERALEHEKVLQREKEERERALEQEKVLQREKERALEQEKERAKVAERERASHLPPWKRSREIGLTPLRTPPLSTGAGKMAATEEGGEPKVPSLPQTASRDNQPAESGTPLSQTLATSLSPQSSFKKFRFLRDPLVLSPSSASLVIKRPRTFSESPHPQALALQSPSKPGEPEQEVTPQGPQPSAGQAAPKKPARQGVLVSVANTSGTTGPERETPVIATMDKSPEEEKGKSLASEEHLQAHKEETDKQAVGEMTRETNAPSVPAGAVLPPSTPPEEGKVEKGRERSQKKEEKQGRRASSSSDSSDSDSGSSSSRSSDSSSSSQGKTHTTPSGRRPEKPLTNTISQHKETVSQPEDPTEAPKAPQHKKRVSGEEKDITIDGARHRKKPFLGIPAGEDNWQKKNSVGEEVKTDTTREVNEADMAEPKRAPESSEESLTPKAFTARRISLSSSKLSQGAVSAEGETESGAGRKRRWGSSTAVTAKKSSMSITTDSLKSLIPDFRPCPGQEVVVDLHLEEDHLSGVEEEDREQDLKIRRTVTQVVPSVTQENGQKESKRSEHEEEDREHGWEVKGDREEKLDDSFQRDSMETQCPSPPSHDMEMKTVTPSDTLIRRSISQQKSGVSITIDDPVRTAKQPSPPRGKMSNIVHVSNLVRPFTLGQLKELLGRTGTVLEDGFWIDKIKSHCYVTYSSAEESMATRAALHGVKWPQSNPKFLSVDFSQQDELDFHRCLPPPERAGVCERGAAAVPVRGVALPPLLPERDQWAEREREMERRERSRAEREWDRDKVRDFGPGKTGEEAGPRRSRSRERKRKEKKTDKKEKAADEPPVKLLDDLFNKTKAAPCIYWLPLTEEQVAQKEAARQERMKEREKRRKEQQEEVEKKKEEERKERMKAGSAASGERGEGERYRERERGRDGESDKHREGGYRRPGGSSAGGGRRSRSRSDTPPRDRRC